MAWKGWQGNQVHMPGVSVYGSGYAVGPKNSESFVGMPTADGYQRFDGGTFSVSGWAKTSFSTRLSTIVYAAAQPLLPQTGLAALASGFISDVGVSWSGNCIDFTLYTSTSGGAGNNGYTSAGTSSKVGWVAIGY